MANYLDSLTEYTNSAIQKIAEQRTLLTEARANGRTGQEFINNIAWWNQLVTGANDTNQTDDLRLVLLTLLVDNAQLNPLVPVDIINLYQPFLFNTGTGAVLWGAIGGDINDQTDLIAKFNTYLALAGGTMTGPLLIDPATRIDASVAGALNIGTVTATIINIGGVGITINTGTIAQGVWNGTAIGVAYGGLGTLDFASGSNGQVPVKSGAGFAWGNPGLGDVVGPGSATDNAIARFDGTTGKLIKNSIVTIGNTGAIAGAISIALSGSTSGTTTIIPTAIAGTTVQTLQATTGTIALLENRLDAFATTTSAQLATVISDETGSGLLVFNDSPTLITPIIGAATGTSLAVTGALTSGVASSTAGTLVLRNATNAFTQTIRGTNPTASIIYDLPTTAPTAGQLLSASAPSGGVVTMGWVGALTNPMTTSGDMIYGGAAGVPTRLAGDTTNTKKFLTATSIAGVAQPPSWGGIVINDLPIITLAKGGTGVALVNPAANRLLGWDNATSAVSFMVIGAGLTYTAGTKTLSVDASGIVVSVTGTANRITSTGGSTPVIDISSAYVGQSSITTLGTIATGDWQAGIIDGEFGGTGLDVSTGTIGDSIRISALGEWEFYTPSGGGGSPGGASGQMQWNNAASFDGVGKMYSDGGNVWIQDQNFFLSDNAGTPTKTVNFNVAAVSGSKTWDFPNTSDTFVGAATAQALSNKTGIISQWTNDAGYLTLASTLSGLSITGSTISSANSIIAAFGALQNQINGILGGATYQGVWNASTNSPSLSSGVGTKGFYYVVSVAGSTNLDGITDWKVGDWAIYNGTAWQKVDNTDAVSSVNGAIGAVVITATGTTNRIVVTGGTGLTPTFDIGTDVVTLTGTQTLSNKTLTSPNLNGSSTTGHVWTASDGSGNGAWAAPTGGGGSTNILMVQVFS